MPPSEDTSATPEELRVRLGAAKRNARGRKVYGPSLRKAVVHYALGRLTSGHTQSSIAAELGIHQAVLSEWLRSRDEDDHNGIATERPVLVLPDGTRVEGLELREIVEVLRSLRR